MDLLIIDKNTIFEENVQINKNLQVLGVEEIDSVNVLNDLNSHNLNTSGLNIYLGNTVSKGDIYISKDDNNNLLI